MANDRADTTLGTGDQAVADKRFTGIIANSTVEPLNSWRECATCIPKGRVMKWRTTPFS